MNSHSKKMLSIRLLLLVLLGLSIWAVSVSAAADSAKHDFTLNDQDGKAVKLSDLQGTIVVLEWVNPDCPFSKRHYSPEVMTITKLVDHYKDKNVVFLSINSTNYFDQAKNKAWHEQLKLKHQILDDRAGTVGKQFKARSTPHIYIINTKGELAYQGAIDDNPSGDKAADQIKNYVKVVVDDLLAGKQPSITETKPYGCSVKYAQ